MIHVITALGQNTTLDFLSFEFGAFGMQRHVTFSPEIETQFASMLEKENRTLRFLTFANYRITPAVSRMIYYVKMNYCGRKGLLENPNASQEEWIRALSAWPKGWCIWPSREGDLDVPFCFLSLNPSLCEGAL